MLVEKDMMCAYLRREVDVLNDEDNNVKEIEINKDYVKDKGEVRVGLKGV